MMMKLKVCWKESGCTFSASITAVNGDGTFDVVRSLYNLNSDKFCCDEWQYLLQVYDELVQDKQCTERSVSADRITSCSTNNLALVNPSKLAEKGETPLPLPYNSASTRADIYIHTFIFVNMDKNK
jgi:hypothetical protein